MSLAANVTLTCPPQHHTTFSSLHPLHPSEHHKGYRCLDLSTNHLVISRHVVFDEAVFPFTASPHQTNDLNFLLSETAPVVPPIGTRLPTGLITPRAATIPPEPSSQADEEVQANPLKNPPQASWHPPLVSRGPVVPAAPFDPTTPVPRVAPAPTPGTPTRPMHTNRDWWHRGPRRQPPEPLLGRPPRHGRRQPQRPPRQAPSTSSLTAAHRRAGSSHWPRSRITA
jgi:hypothetical protein